MIHSDLVLKYFHEHTHDGAMSRNDPAVAFAEIGRVDQHNLLCLYVRFHQGKITEAKFQAYASVLATACCEYICGWLMGKTADEIKLDAEHLKTALKLSNTQMHDAILVVRLVEKVLEQKP